MASGCERERGPVVKVDGISIFRPKLWEVADFREFIKYVDGTNALQDGGLIKVRAPDTRSVISRATMIFLDSLISCAVLFNWLSCIFPVDFTWVIAVS